MVWPRKVSMPLAAPTGSWMPSGNGFDKVARNVSPLSRVVRMFVVWLKPL
jgi:hypothetical protein